MKKRTLFIFAIIIITSKIGIGQNFYTNFGYSFSKPIGGALLSYQTTEYNVTTDTVESFDVYNQHKISLGKGNLPMIGLGYKIKPNFFVEVNLAFFKGKPIKHLVETNINVVYGYNYFADFSYTHTSKAFIANPILKYISNREINNFYVNLGLIYAYSIIDEELKVTSYNGGSGFSSPFNSYTEKWKYYDSFSFGYNLDLGYDYKLSGNLNIYAELGFMTIRTITKKGEMYEYTVNGESEFENLDKSEKNVVCSESFSENDKTDSYSYILPKEFITETLQLKFGLRYNFGTH